MPRRSTDRRHQGREDDVLENSSISILVPGGLGPTTHHRSEGAEIGYVNREPSNSPIPAPIPRNREQRSASNLYWEVDPAWKR